MKELWDNFEACHKSEEVHRTMKIGINATARLSGGSVVYLKQILEQWTHGNIQNSYVIFSIPTNMTVLKEVSHRKRCSFFIVSRIFSFFIIKSLWEQILLPFYLKSKKIDLLFSPGNFCPLFSRVKNVVFLQNAGPFCRSITPRQVGLYTWTWFKVVGFLMRLSARRADHVIFISRHLKDYFIRNYGFPEEKGAVVYFGRKTNISPSLKANRNLLKECGISNKYALVVSHLYSYKNIPQLIDGFAKAMKSLDDKTLQLVIAGRIVDRKYYLKITKVIEQHGIKGQVRFLGEIPQSKVFRLYAHCLFFIFTSTCESFGNVLLEAMSSNVPILCSSLSVMPEICGDSALYLNPYDVQDIAGKIALLVKDETLRRDLSQRAMTRAQQFPTWQEVSKRTLELIEHAEQRDR